MALLTLELFEILRGFSSLFPPNSLTFPTHLSPSTIHDFLLESILLNSHFKTYPPSAQYQKTFWKWAINNLEIFDSEEDFEIDPRIYDHYLSLMPPSGLALGPAKVDSRGQAYPQGLPLQAPPSQSYVTHFWRASSGAPESHTPTRTVDPVEYETITLLESRTTIESGTTGLRTWLASFVLSQYLINHPDLVRNKHVLELGSGIGFLGIIIASLQQNSTLSNTHTSTLCMTDINEDVLTRCRANIQLPCNKSSSNRNITYRLVDWSSALDPEMWQSLNHLYQDEIKADLILGADLIFDPTLVPALIATIKLCLQPGHTSSIPKSTLIAVTVRNLNTLATFLSVAQKERLRVEELTKQDQTTFLETIENNDHDNVRLFRFTLQGVGI